MIPFSNIVAKY